MELTATAEMSTAATPLSIRVLTTFFLFESVTAARQYTRAAMKNRPYLKMPFTGFPKVKFRIKKTMKLTIGAKASITVTILFSVFFNIAKSTGTAIQHMVNNAMYAVG